VIGQAIAWCDSSFLTWYLGNSFLQAVCSFYKVKYFYFDHICLAYICPKLVSRAIYSTCTCCWYLHFKIHVY
jgi:hypothetical protein